MPLRPGAPGPYEVLAPLGRAESAGLSRPRPEAAAGVALKVLPDAVARDRPACPLRARGARPAALNHPHIAGIYGIAEDQGITALVLELVEGPTLDNIWQTARFRSGNGGHRASSRRGARSRSRSRHRPSRPQARQHQAAARRLGEGARFRAGEGHRGPFGHRRRIPGLDDSTRRCHCAGADSRHGGLHGARAGARPDGGQARGHLGLRRGGGRC